MYTLNIMILGEYAYYLTNRSSHHKVLNMITLEFSNTNMNLKLQSPLFVRNIDWIDLIWPLERRIRGDYPKGFLHIYLSCIYHISWMCYAYMHFIFMHA